MKVPISAGLSGVFNFLFPRFCYGCHSRIETGWICDECKNELRAGLRFSEKLLPPLSSVSAVWHYDGAVRGAIDDWKFANLPALGDLIIRDGFSDEWLEKSLTGKYDAIIGIPPHSYHLRERGFDPVEQIVGYLSKKLCVPVHNVLTRTKNVKPQVESSLAERIKNVEGSFSTQKKPVGNVLLIDDVLTTGSTLREASKLLIANGAEQVDAIVIASAGGKAIIQGES